MVAILYLVANIDRFVLNLMIESIKRDFGASDVQVSLLAGFSFSLFYVLCGFWIARLADRFNRRNILTVGAILWSLFTAAAGAAQNFAQLFVTRMGVGVGEGAIVPCGQSMIADEVPEESLGRAMSVFSVGSLLGALMAFSIGGLLIGWSARTWPEGLEVPFVGVIFNWQVVFYIVGLPGVLLALLFLVTVKEPRRRLAPAELSPDFGSVLSFMGANKRVYIAILGGVTAVQLGAASASTWLPALFERNFGIMPEEAGLWIVSALVFPGVMSALLGGWLGDRMLRQGSYESYVRLASIACFVGFLPFGLAPIMPSVTGLVVLAALGTFATFMTQTLSIAALQAIAPGNMRATMAALMTIAIALVAYGCGPLIVAMITDFLFADEAKLGLSLTIVLTGSVFLAACLYRYGSGDFGQLLAAQRG